MSKLNNALIKSYTNYTSKADKRNNLNKGKNEELPPNKGKLQAGATVADQYITFPIDAKILNSSRKQLDKMIDVLYQRFVYEALGISKHFIYSLP